MRARSERIDREGIWLWTGWIPDSDLCIVLTDHDVGRILELLR